MDTAASQRILTEANYHSIRHILTFTDSINAFGYNGRSCLDSLNRPAFQNSDERF